MMEAGDFSRRFEAAEAGDAIVYHTGVGILGLDGRRSPAAELAWDLGETDRAHLVQRRVGTRFEYTAIKRPETNHRFRRG